MTLLISKTCHPVSAFFKTRPVGVDIPIQRHQSFLYTALKTVWGIQNDTSWNSHGRAYRNQTEDGYCPEVYVGVGNQPGSEEYREVLFDDQLTALSFYGMDEVGRNNTGNTTVGVFLVFMVNVLQLKPSITWRGDEEIRNDVEKLCQVDRFDMQWTGFVTGIDSVFKEYSGWRKNIGIKFRDMHPRHCFRLNFNLLFDINDCYQPLPNNF